MACKTMYTQYDIYAYKCALARHAAKTNYLVDKWTRRLDNQLSGDSQISRIIQEFVTDLQLPADMYLSEFEMRGCV